MPPFDGRFGEVHLRNDNSYTPEERIAQLERQIADCDEGTFNARYDKLYKANNRGAMRAREELMRLRAQYGYERRQEFRVGYEDDDCRAGCSAYGQSYQDCYECEQHYMAGCDQVAQYRIPGQVRGGIEYPAQYGRIPEGRDDLTMLDEEAGGVKRGAWESEGVPVYGISYGPHDGKIHGSSQDNINSRAPHPQNSSRGAAGPTHRILLNPKNHKDEDGSSEDKPKKKAPKTSHDKPHDGIPGHNKAPKKAHDKPHDKPHGQAHDTLSTSHGTPHGPNEEKSATKAQHHSADRAHDTPHGHKR